MLQRSLPPIARVAPARRSLRLPVNAAAAPEVAISHSNGHANGHAAATAETVLPLMVPAAQIAAAPAAPTAPAPPAAAPAVTPPGATFQTVSNNGAAIAKYSITKTLVLGIYAGAYIAFGGYLGAAMVTNCPGVVAANPGMAKVLFGLSLPFGLLLSIMHGAELFTGNTMKLAAAVAEKKASLQSLAKNWAWSYVGNLIGSLAVVGLVVASGTLAGAQMPVQAAMMKTSLPWMQAFVRGVLANFLVCMAVWCAMAANSLPGKALGCWPPVTAFLAIGLEHSVANMFVVPLGMALGAPVSMFDFLVNNLVPVTLGNIVGGALLVGLTSSYLHGSGGKPKLA